MSIIEIDQKKDYHHWLYDPDRMSHELFKSEAYQGFILHGFYQNEAKFWDDIGYDWSEHNTNSFGGPDYEY